MRHSVTKKYFIILVAFIAIFAISFSGCTKNPEEKKKEVIKIGAILPLTGPISFFGEYEKNAIELAVQEINEKGGIRGKQVEVLYEDSKNEPKEAITAMNKLVNINKVAVIITQMSSVSMALAPIADQTETVVVSLAMHPEFAKKSKYAFRIYESVSQESEAMAALLIKKGYQNIAVIYIEDVWGQEAKAAFENKIKSLGKELLFEESYQVREKDFKTILLDLKNKQVDAVFLAGYGPGVGIFAKQFKEQNIKAALFGNIGMSWDYVLKIGGEALNGAIVVMPRFLASESHGERFVDQYTANYGKEPNFESAFAYDAFNIIIKAIKTAGYSANSIQKGIAAMKEYEGISGKLIFDNNGDTLLDSVTFRIIKEGALHNIE